ncbi:unnamed protein product [Dibothriocephalus latus]|uniref:DNA replication factor Dna2 N-terminal domain-containing protein n=1 Tax=Dibothriocephalus latus TaxID=60516 RepID=A0A3P7QT84_DIBLA|nr:unnamed protein product [Dibothriocephalus latus]
MKWIADHPKRLGVKGKIDMTVSCSPVGLTSSKDSTDRPLMIPFELKTGRASYSFEHIGQVGRPL